MQRILTYQIENLQNQESIGTFLKSKGYSRHILTHLKRTENGICVNGEWTRPYRLLQNGDFLTVTIIEEETSDHIVPTEMDLNIVYEDEDLLVINKEADVPIHPSIHNYENTLANGVAWYYQKRGEPFVYRCINRLDRDTTGLLIIAKNMLSAAILSEMGKRREIHREYLAIAQGCVPFEGVIDAPIARKEGSVLERCVDFENGEMAVTHFQRLRTWDGYSLVALKLETGRTHQIRVHMKYLGYPLIGDFLYNPDFRLLQHQALHSWKLEFSHPITGERMKFEAKAPWMGLVPEKQQLVLE